MVAQISGQESHKMYFPFPETITTHLNEKVVIHMSVKTKV